LNIFDYRFTLPLPFQAEAGRKYWIQIEALQNDYPDWAIVAGTGGDGSHFMRMAYVGHFGNSSAPGDAAFTLR
jgi:hypothetical protein